MNKFFTLAFVFSFFQNLYGQNKPNDFFVIEPSAFPYDKKLPFKSIEIVDSRFDTTKVGYRLMGYTYEKLIVQPNLANAIQKKLSTCLRTNLDSTSHSTLLIVIKNLWIQQPGLRKDGSYQNECTAKLELYLKKDEAFYPLTRIDSVYTFKNSKRNGDVMLTTPFQQCLERLQTLNPEKTHGLRKLSWNDIHGFNEQRFQKPIFKSTILRKGIYLSFNDFLEDRIDGRPFEIKFETLSDQLYLIDKGESKLFTEFWGFCDGSKLYINAQLNFYELKRCDKGFEFWGNEQVIQYKYSPQFRANAMTSAGIAAGLANYGIDKLSLNRSKNLRPFQINMENGGVY